MNETSSPLQLIKIKTVEDMTTLSRATIYRLIKGEEFPQGKMIVQNRRVWTKSEVESWIRERMS